MRKTLSQATLGLAALVGLALFAQGCASDPAVAATSPPGYIYPDDDDVAREYPVTVDQARRAVELTMQELNMTRIRWDDERGHLELEADAPEGGDVEVEIRAIGPNRTIINVDYGGERERERALAFHERLQRHLQSVL